MTTETRFSVALFGAGRIGHVHAKNIAEHGLTQLTYVVDPNEAAARELAHTHGAEVATEARALEDGSVDAILIASATSTHAGLIERGLLANKAVFCEKPIDLSLSRVNGCLSAVSGASAPLFIGFNRRFDPAVAEMKRRISAGEIGDLELVTIVSKDPGALPIEYLKGSGGMFRDMTIHDFDMARFILGEEIVSVTATASTLTDEAILEIGDIDTAVVTMQAASGRIVVITNSRRASFGYDQRVEAHGSGGTLRTENVPISMLVQETEAGVRREKPQYFFLERYQQSYRNEWDHFVRVIAGQENPSPTGEDGRKALVLAEAAYTALKSGKIAHIDYELEAAQ